MQYILHIDMNKFYASVEQMLNPSLKNKAIAVCGSAEERHGIVLTASKEAKAMGVKTGMANWEARQMCPGLIVVPPQYDQYVKYSRLARSLYSRYSAQIEPYGMDENWVDISRLCRSFRDAEEIANEIREAVKSELGLTVSIGVSFSKIFAKLGSDMKKPDAVTVLDDVSWRDRVWPLPVSELLYVGNATTRRLMNCNVRTIGDIANADVRLLMRWFGKNGGMLWLFANGQDHARVMPSDFVSPVKSIGHGITCSRDLQDNDDAWRVILELSQDIGHRLRLHGLAAYGVQVAVRSNELRGEQYQKPMPMPTQSPLEIARTARELFESRYNWRVPVRTLCVRAINLIPHGDPLQLDLFSDTERHIRQEKLDDCIDELRGRFGEHCIMAASLLQGTPIPRDGREKVRMPDRMYQ